MVHIDMLKWVSGVLALLCAVENQSHQVPVATDDLTGVHSAHNLQEQHTITSSTSLLQGCYTKQSEITTIKLKLAKEKDNQPSHLHGHIKVGGFPVFPFDEHLLGGINQEHQAVSPCNFVVSYWRWRPGLFCCHFSITFCINATCQHFTCAEVDFNN